MPWRTTILALIVSTLLVGLAILSVQSNSDQSGITGNGPLATAEQFPMDSLSQIEFQRDADTWTFVREEDGWWQQQPFRVPIQDYHLNALASALRW